MEIYEETESSASSSSPSPSEEEVVVAAPTNSTVVMTQKRKAGRKKFKETRHPIFRGVRERNRGKWVCEVREPNKKSRIWLGTFTSPDMAARAYDVAAIALRGKSAILNFPDSAWLLPRAKSSSPKDIQLAALQAANSFPPATTNCSPSSSSSSLSFTSPAVAAEELPSPRVEEEREKGADVEISATMTASAVSTTTSFVDEEELFNMPGLLDSMAEGMLLTPPSMELSWDDVDHHMDFSLWTD